MQKALSLHPVDIPVALSLVEVPRATFQQIGGMLGISSSTAHEATARLRQAGLVKKESLEVVRSALLEFLEHGVRYAFPAVLQAEGRGVPTAHAGPLLRAEIVADFPFVWPTAGGTAVGPSITPLFRQAIELPSRSPGVYALLTLVDALRVGRIRERELAIGLLRNRLYPSAALAA
jgi:hypothetical protein